MSGHDRDHDRDHGDHHGCGQLPGSGNVLDLNGRQLLDTGMQTLSVLEHEMK